MTISLNATRNSDTLRRKVRLAVNQLAFLQRKKGRKAREAQHMATIRMLCCIAFVALYEAMRLAKQAGMEQAKVMMTEAIGAGVAMPFANPTDDQRFAGISLVAMLREAIQPFGAQLVSGRLLEIEANVYKYSIPELEAALDFLNRLDQGLSQQDQMIHLKLQVSKMIEIRRKNPTATGTQPLQSISDDANGNPAKPDVALEGAILAFYASWDKPNRTEQDVADADVAYRGAATMAPQNERVVEIRQLLAAYNESRKATKAPTPAAPVTATTAT